MAFVPLAAAVVSAAGTMAQGIATANAANYNAQVARNNATVMEQNAEYAAKAGFAKTEASSLKGRAVGGKVLTSLAANGVDVNTGSALDVRVSQREQQKLDTEMVRHNAELESYGYRVKAEDYRNQAVLKEYEADFAPWGAALKAGGTLLEKWPSVSGAFGGGATPGGTAGGGAGAGFGVMGGI